MPLNLPAQITAGDSLRFVDTVGDYSAADGWVLKYSLSNGGEVNTIESAAEGSDHGFTVAATATANWRAGQYRWQAYVAKGIERITVGRGFCEVLADIINGEDARHHVEKTLAALEAMLEGKANQDQQTMTLNGRSLTRLPVEELLKWRDRYKAELARVKRAERVAQGLGSNRIRVRFK